STALLPSLHRLIDFGWIPQHSCLHVSLNPKQFQHLEEMCKTMRHELRTKEVGWERMALGNMLLITAFLQRSIEEPQEQAVSAQSSGKKSDLVQMCSNYVCRNLGEDLTLKTVSKRFAVSGEYLTRSFTREMGISCCSASPKANGCCARRPTSRSRISPTRSGSRRPRISTGISND
ncbi:MAG: hypothetical protein K0Q59_2708, partial [Paenibacillus sp.]|nr:hypothetical protein [Paenibacillus sp.]